MAADGSITAVVDLNVSRAEKQLAKFKDNIKKTEQEIERFTKKRDEAKGKGLLDAQVLDAEKAKLAEMRKELEEIKSISKDKSLSASVRAAAKEAIPQTVLDIREQAERVRLLQSEWNKTENEVDGYTKKIEEATEKLERQKEEAGALEKAILDARMAQGEPLAGQENDIGDRLEQQAQKIEQARQDIEAAVDRVKSVLGSMPDVAERMFPGINQAFDNIIRKAQETFEKVKESAKEALPEQVTSDMERVSESFKLVFSRLSESVPEFLKDYAAHVLAAVRTIKENLPSSLGDLSQSIISGLQNILPKINDALEKGGIGEVGKQALSGILDVISSISPKVAIAIEALKLLGYAFQKLWSVAVKESVMLANGIKTAFTGVVSAVKEAPNAIKKFVNAASSGLKKVSKVFREITNSIVSFLKNINVLSRLSDKLNRVFTKLGSTIRRVFVYSTLTSFFRALRTQVSEYLSLNAEFMTALGRLKSALATAFQPILDVIIPALTALVNMLTSVISVIAQFIAALFGTTAKRAQANAKALNSQAGATEAAGNAAEKASQQLAAFDEINTLTFDEGGGGSGGGGGGGGAELGDALFDLDLDDTWFNSWGEAFDAFLDHILNEGIPAFRKALEEFAGWVNWLSENLLEMFTFPGVKEKLELIGEEVADAINNMFDLIDWDQLGRALGAGLDDLVALINGFLDNIDSKGLGEHLAELINGLVDMVDWEAFGRMLFGGFEMGLKTLAGLLEKLNMPLLADAVSSVIKGFFDQMKKVLANDIEWKKIGNQIATFFNNLDWYGIITSVAGAIAAGVNGFFTMLREFIDELHWDDIAKQIGNAINDSLDFFDWKLIATTLGDAFEKVFNFLQTLIETIDWHKIGEIIGQFILDFDFVSALGALADLIAVAINAAVQVACGLLDIIEPEAYNIGNGISERIRNAVETVDWAKLGETVGRAIKTALSFVAGLLDPNTFYAIGKAIGEFFINLDWPGILEKLGNAIANGIKSAVAIVRGFLDTVGPNLRQLALDIAEKINNFVHNVDWKELGKTIHDGIKAALDFLLTILQNLDWKSIGQAIVDFFTGLDWPDLLSKWSEVIGTAIGNVLKGIDLGSAIEFGVRTVLAMIEGLTSPSSLTALIGGALNIIEGIIEGLVKAIPAIIEYAPQIIANLVIGIISAIPQLIEVGVQLIAGIIEGMIKAIVAIPAAIARVVESIIEGFKSLFGIASPSTVMEELGGYLIEGLLLGITNAWNSIVEFFAEALAALLESIGEAWDNIKTAAEEAWENIKTAISDAWDNITTVVGDTIEQVQTTISDTWESIKETTSEIWENIKTAISDAWDNIKTVVEDTIDAVKTTIIDTWENLKQTTSDIWEAIKTAISDAWDNIKTVVTDTIDAVKKNIEETWNNIKTTTSEIWENISKAISDTWVNIKTAVSDTISEIAKNISDTWENIKKTAVDKWNEIKGKISDAWENIKTAVKDKYEELKKNISDAWENVKTEAGNKWNEIKTTISDKWNEIKTAAVDKFQEIKQSVIDKISELKSFDWFSIGKTIVDGIVNGLKSISNTLSSWAKGVKDTISNAISGAKTAASNALNSVGFRSYSIPASNPIAAMGNITIPRLAAGAVIPPNREFMAVLGDQNNGRNLEAPEALIRKIVREESGGGNEQLLSVLQTLNSLLEKGFAINVDGSTFGRTAIKTINSVNAGAGRQLLKL